MARRNEQLLFNPSSNKCIQIDESTSKELLCGKDIRADKTVSESGGNDNDPCAPNHQTEPKDFNFNKDASLEDMFVTYNFRQKNTTVHEIEVEWTNPVLIYLVSC